MNTGLLAALGEYVFAAIAGLLAMLLGLVRWIYVRDAKAIEQTLLCVRTDHRKLIEAVHEINETRPRRVELEEAVENLRQENASGFASLRAEIRSDITGLRTDMTTRLDTLIRLHSGK